MLRCQGTEASLFSLIASENSLRATQWQVQLLEATPFRKLWLSNRLVLLLLQFLYIKEAFCPSLEEKISVLAEVSQYVQRSAKLAFC